MYLKPVLHLNGPAAYVIFENILKEGINIACKAGVFRCAIDDREFRRVRKWFQGRGCRPLLIPGRALKKHLLYRLGLIKPVVPCRKEWLINNTNSAVWYTFWVI